MDGMFGLVAYEASDDEAQTSSQPSDNAGGVVLLTGINDSSAVEHPQDTAHDVDMSDAQDTEQPAAPLSEQDADALELARLQAMLPPDIYNPPDAQCDPELQERVAELLRRQHNSGKRISIEIRKNRDYRNPYFLEKMVAFYGVDGVATAFSPDVFDPHALPEEDYAQALLAEFQAWQAKRREERERTQRIEFHKSTSHSSLQGAGARAPMVNPKALQEAREKAQALAAKLAAQRR